MIAVDTNVLVYAHCRAFSLHSKAAHLITSLAEGSSPWGVPSVCVHEFLRIVTHPRVLTSPYPLDQAVAALNRVFASPSAEILLPGDGHWSYLSAALSEGGARGNLVFDAAVVAICRENGVSVLYSEDRDFDRYAGLPTRRL